MKLWVGVTDQDWFDHLRNLEPNEVNFWQPNGARTFSILEPGELFLFQDGGGYCWDWSNPKPDGTLVDDAVIGDWRRPWNAPCIGNKSESRDRTVKQSKGDFLQLVKNTYRVLLSRGMKGCYVCFLDKDTERFVRSRMERVESIGVDRMVAEPTVDYKNPSGSKEP